VLRGESSDEYESLLEGLAEALQPENELEKLLVEKLAMLSWRYRRLLQAEGAEIQQGSEFLEWDQKMQQQHEAEIAKRTLVRSRKTFADRPGLIPEMQNPEILDYSVELLLGLQRRVKSLGFDQEEYDRSILEIIYGAVSNLHGTLLNTYYGWLKASPVPEEERQRMGYPTPERCKDRLVSEIGAEIQCFRNYRQEQAEKESERTKL
jgi:hypothetical protein